jgi:anti-sigma B factor antagonist
MPVRRDIKLNPAWGLDIEERSLAACRVIVLGGEIDMFTAPLLEPTVRSALDRGAGGVIIDLRAATFLDAAGFTALLTCSGRVSGAGRKCAVVASEAYAVELVFAVTGGDPRLPLCPDQRAALEFVSR